MKSLKKKLHGKSVKSKLKTSNDSHLENVIANHKETIAIYEAKLKDARDNKEDESVIRDIRKNIDVHRELLAGAEKRVGETGSMKTGGDVDIEKVKLKYAKQDIALLEKEGSMAITDTKHGVLWGEYVDGVFSFNVQEKHIPEPKNVFKGNKKDAIEFVKNSYTVEMATGGGIKDVSTPEQFKEWATERKMKLIDELDGFKVGDKVTFTNEYGVVFEPRTIIGIDKDDSFYNRRFYLNNDSYWFPHKIGEIKPYRGSMASGGGVELQTGRKENFKTMRGEDGKLYIKVGKKEYRVGDAVLYTKKYQYADSYERRQAFVDMDKKSGHIGITYFAQGAGGGDHRFIIPEWDKEVKPYSETTKYEREHITEGYGRGGSMKTGGEVGDYFRSFTLPSGEESSASVRYNPMWKKWQFSVDGAPYGEFNTREEAMNEIKNSGLDKYINDNEVQMKLSKDGDKIKYKGSYKNITFEGEGKFESHDGFYDKIKQEFEAKGKMSVEDLMKIRAKMIEELKNVGIDFTEKSKMAIGGSIQVAQKGIFSIDSIENKKFKGYTFGDDWNGFAVPYFEIEEATEIAHALGGKKVYDKKPYFLFPEHGEREGSFADYTDGPYEQMKIKTVDGEKTVYPIGAYNWIWEEIGKAHGGSIDEKYHWKKRPDGSFGIYNQRGLQVTVVFSKESAEEYLKKANNTKEYEISNSYPVKKSKYELGDEVYSWQNPDYPAPVVRRNFSAWEHESKPHENDTWKYLVRLKDGQRSKWMGEDSLFKTKQREYKDGGSISNHKDSTHKYSIGDTLRVITEKGSNTGKEGVVYELSHYKPSVAYPSGTPTYKIHIASNPINFQDHQFPEDELEMVHKKMAGGGKFKTEDAEIPFDLWYEYKRPEKQRFLESISRPTKYSDYEWSDLPKDVQEKFEKQAMTPTESKQVFWTLPKTTPVHNKPETKIIIEKQDPTRFKVYFETTDGIKYNVQTGLSKEKAQKKAEDLKYAIETGYALTERINKLHN